MGNLKKAVEAATDQATQDTAADAGATTQETATQEQGEPEAPADAIDVAALQQEVEELKGKCEALKASVDSFYDLKAEVIADAVQTELAKHPLMQEAARRAQAAANADKARAEAEAKDRKAAKASEKALAEAEAKRAEQLDNARSAFAAAMDNPFTGAATDILPKTVKGLLFDDGSTFNIDQIIEIDAAKDLRFEPDGVVITKPITLDANQPPFKVAGATLLTDGGALRVEFITGLIAGGGRAPSFPAGHIKIRPFPPVAPTDEAEGADAE